MYFNDICLELKTIFINRTTNWQLIRKQVYSAIYRKKSINYVCPYSSVIFASYLDLVVYLRKKELFYPQATTIPLLYVGSCVAATYRAIVVRSIWNISQCTINIRYE